MPAFEDATARGMCTGAILRAPLNGSFVQPFSWGYRNPFGLRFAPRDHALQGGLFVTENGEDYAVFHSHDRVPVTDIAAATRADPHRMARRP